MSHLSQLSDWPINLTTFLFGHKRFGGGFTQPMLLFRL